MNLLPKLGVLLSADIPKDELDAYLRDLRESLTTSNKQFLALPILALVALATYHLAVYEGVTGMSYGGVQIGGVVLFRKVFLVIPALLLVYAASVGYLRRWQREIYDYLTISRSRLFGTTGLHELRLPSDHLVGLHLIHWNGGQIGKLVTFIHENVAFGIETVAPVVYIVHASAENVAHFGYQDYVTVIFAAAALALTAASLLILALAWRLKVELPAKDSAA